MISRVSRRASTRVPAGLILLLAFAAPSAAADSDIRVAFWNVRSGKGIIALSGHAAPFVDTTNCTDPSQPLNAWGTGASQRAMTGALSDPSVVALGVAESWYSVCASPDRIRQALGWKSATGEQNGVALIARYGFAGPEQWRQLDTALNTNPNDTMWVVRAPVCLDAACSRSMAVYVAHWYGTGTNGSTTYAKQAQQTVDYMAATSSGQPHVLVGDLNVWEGTSSVCNQTPNNTALSPLKSAGYLDAWLTVNGGGEGYTGMINRAGCGYPEGYAWKRIDYAWTRLQPTAMTRFAMVPPGDASPSDHYGVLVTLQNPFGSTVTTSAPAPSSTGTPTTTTTSTGSTTSGGDIVLYAHRATTIKGAWSAVSDATAAGGFKLANPDAGAGKLAAALTAPANYFELPFVAEPGRAYRLWIRGRAQNDAWQNDSAFVQFTGSLASGGTQVFRTGTTSATVVSIEEGSGAGVSGWGWEDNGYGFGTLGQLIYFDQPNQTLRVQVREDGLSIDQIVLSPVTYLTARPGSAKNDSTILAATTLSTTTAATTTTTTTTTATTTSTTTTPTTATTPITTPTTTTTSPTSGIEWISVVKSTSNGSELWKSSGCGECSDAGAVSRQTISANGAVTFTVTGAKRLVAGLGSDRSASTSYAIDYAFSFNENGTFEIRELGVYKSEGSFAPTDTFSIRVTAGLVTYYRNGALVYTSRTAAGSVLGVDASLQSLGAGLTTVTLEGAF